MAQAGKEVVMRHDVQADVDAGEALSTPDRVLEATEALCAEFGLESVSIRDIARRAGVSISVIYHHYGSKIDLLKAVIYRRLNEFFSIQRDLLAELESLPNPPLEKVLRAIVAPLPLLRSKGDAGEITALFLARVLMSTLPDIKREVDAGAGRLAPLIEIVRRAAPHLSREEVFWRTHFTIGIGHMTMWDYERLEIMSGGLCDAGSVEKSIDHAVAFAKAGFEAP
jgi:AcrR family transcriptional regulator